MDLIRSAILLTYYIKFVHKQKVKQLLNLKGKVKIDYDREKEEELEMKYQEERPKKLRDE